MRERSLYQNVAREDLRDRLAPYARVRNRDTVPPGCVLSQLHSVAMAAEAAYDAQDLLVERLRARLREVDHALESARREGDFFTVAERREECVHVAATLETAESEARVARDAANTTERLAVEAWARAWSALTTLRKIAEGNQQFNTESRRAWCWQAVSELLGGRGDETGVDEPPAQEQVDVDGDPEPVEEQARPSGRRPLSEAHKEKLRQASIATAARKREQAARP